MALRGVEVLSDAPFPNLVNMGVFVVKVRTLAHLRAALDQVSAGWVGKIITRSVNENHNLQPINDILNEAVTYFNEFQGRRRLDRWLAHIPANEPNNWQDNPVTYSQYQTYFANFTRTARDQINASGITQIPATTPPLAPWGPPDRPEYQEANFITAMKNATVDGTPALRLRDRWGHIIRRKYACHHYWNSCHEIGTRIYHGMGYYALNLFGFAAKPIVVDECNSNPPSHGGQPPYDGYNDFERQRDLKFFTWLVENDRYHQGTNTKVEAFAGFARAASTSQWHDFDYQDSLWANYGAFTYSEFDNPQTEWPCTPDLLPPN